MQSESTNNSMSGGGGAQGTANSGSANNLGGVHTNGGGSPEQSPHSVDSNSNAPTSSLSMLPVAAAAAAALVQSTRHSLLAASDSNASITPSISLIPIKQVRFNGNLGDVVSSPPTCITSAELSPAPLSSSRTGEDRQTCRQTEAVPEWNQRIRIPVNRRVVLNNQPQIESNQKTEEGGVGYM